MATKTVDYTCSKCHEQYPVTVTTRDRVGSAPVLRGGPANFLAERVQVVVPAGCPEFGCGEAVIIPPTL